MATNFVSMIEKKKHGNALTVEEVQFWIKGVTNGTIPDYQSAAMLMAIRLRGMTFEETVALTKAMTSSGTTLKFAKYPALFDKHSTGGVGDKVTMILAPMLAAVGLPVTMLSGRGLGFTGGTIDKLQSVPGVSCDQDAEAMANMIEVCGWANAMATKDVAPADRKLYALRDVTATVDSVPLITASILSKKLAGGATHLCLDVKSGRAAFMSSEEQARELATSLKTIGEMCGLKVSGLLTRMSEPLGHAVGNYLEMIESVAYLKSYQDTALMDVVMSLAIKMMRSGEMFETDELCGERLLQVIESGEALKSLYGYLEVTGGTPEAIQVLDKASYEDFDRIPLVAKQSGFLSEIDGLALGWLMVDLGAGRHRQEDEIDPIAGLTLEKHLGDSVQEGEVVGWLYGTKALASPGVWQERAGESFKVATQAMPKPSAILGDI
jgi:pyrimidine-nucleoside phosphorylase